MNHRRLTDAVVAGGRARRLLGHDRWSTGRLRTHQQVRLDRLVRHAVARSAFYRNHYDGVDLDQPVALAQLPPVDKATMMAHFDDVVTDPRLRLAELEPLLAGMRADDLYLDRFRVLCTGGSTGRRGVFVIDRDEWRTHLAGLLRVNEYIGLRPRLPRRRRVATIAAAHAVHVTRRLSQSLDIGLHNMLRLDATTPVPELVGPLNRHQPEYLYSYPSILELLAAEQLDGRLRIAPSTIMSSGETHTEDAARAVRAAWDVPWFQLYGATEAPVLGAHCAEHAGLHVFEDLTIVEVVDEENRPVPPGRPGHRLLVTNLVNRTQPLIRYELSDLATASAAPCSCGRPFRLLAGVDGRSDDILSVHGIAVHPLALRSALAAVGGLTQYRVHHDGRGLTVQAALRTGAVPDQVRAAITRGLRAALSALGVSEVAIDVRVVDRIADGRDDAGKLRVVESSCLPGQGGSHEW